MTTPHGFPDYQSYPLWRGNPLVAGNQFVSGSSPTHAESWVTNWQAMNVVCTNLTGSGVTITITYYTDSTKTVQVGFFSWILSVANAKVAVCVPNLANYVTVDITTGEAGTFIVATSIGPVNVPVGKPAYEVNNNSVQNRGVVIAGLASSTAQIPAVVEGDGYYLVYKHAGATGFDVEIDQLSEAGVQTATIARVLGVNGVTSGTFVSTSSTIQITVSNNDAAAQTFDIYCTAISR